MNKEEFKETYFDLDGCDLSEASKIYHCIDRGESDLADKILGDYTNQRVIQIRLEELEYMLSLCEEIYDTDEGCLGDYISDYDIEKRIQELKQNQDD
jgi:hypothetical protein